MKKEMKMMPNGNYEEVLCAVQHHCKSECSLFWCKEYSWNLGNLEFTISDGGDPYEGGYENTIPVKFCPFCGYSPKRKQKNEDPKCCGRSMTPSFGNDDNDGWFCENCTKWIGRFESKK